jgi:hypothetical protein
MALRRTAFKRSQNTLKPGKAPALKTKPRKHQGFLTSRNRYVNRVDALEMHQALGIPSADKTGYREGIMFSEDLY